MELGDVRIFSRDTLKRTAEAPTVDLLRVSTSIPVLSIREAPMNRTPEAAVSWTLITLFENRFPFNSPQTEINT